MSFRIIRGCRRVSAAQTRWLSGRLEKGGGLVTQTWMTTSCSKKMSLGEKM